MSPGSMWSVLCVEQPTMAGAVQGQGLWDQGIKEFPRPRVLKTRCTVMQSTGPFLPGFVAPNVEELDPGPWHRSERSLMTVLLLANDSDCSLNTPTSSFSATDSKRACDQQQLRPTLCDKQHFVKSLGRADDCTLYHMRTASTLTSAWLFSALAFPALCPCVWRAWWCGLLVTNRPDLA